MGQLLKKDTAANITVLMVQSADHVTGKTGLAAGLTIYLTKAGTAAAITPTVTEVDSVNVPGVYKLQLTSGHTDTLGEFSLHVTGAAADPTDEKHQVVPDLPGNLAAAAIQAIWDALTSALTTAGSIGKLLVDKLDAAISTRLATGGYTAPPSVGAIADQVWDEAIAGHLGAGSTGLALASAASAGDPWATALPGAYGAGTAGKIVGDNINAPIGSVPTANANADALLDRTAGIETNRTIRQGMRLMLSVICGKLNGSPTTALNFRDTNDTKNRVAATVDANGNRTAITYDAT